MMTSYEILNVVQSNIEGKKIESKLVMQPQAGWHFEAEPITWDFLSKYYRVAPEPRKPREWTLVECQGELYSKFDGVFPKYVRVREIIEDKNCTL